MDRYMDRWRDEKINECICRYVNRQMDVDYNMKGCGQMDGCSIEAGCSIEYALTDQKSEPFRPKDIAVLKPKLSSFEQAWLIETIESICNVDPQHLQKQWCYTLHSQKRKKQNKKKLIGLEIK